VLFSSDAELWLFVDWELLGVANRPKAGKNPTEAISGPWVRYNQPDRKKRGKSGTRRGRPYLRGSDLAMRRFVAIAALREQGFGLENACIEVGTRLGKKAAKEFKSIGTSYHKYRHPFREQLLAHEVNFFGLWMESEIRFNILVSAIPLYTLQNHSREEALGRGCNDGEADDFAEKWRGLAERALVILKENPEKVWAPDFRRLIDR
jgi:hypothetical protein